MDVVFLFLLLLLKASFDDAMNDAGKQNDVRARIAFPYRRQGTCRTAPVWRKIDTCDPAVLVIDGKSFEARETNASAHKHYLTNRIVN